MKTNKLPPVYLSSLSGKHPALTSFMNTALLAVGLFQLPDSLPLCLVPPGLGASTSSSHGFSPSALLPGSPSTANSLYLEWGHLGKSLDQAPRPVLGEASPGPLLFYKAEMYRNLEGSLQRKSVWEWVCAGWVWVCMCRIIGTLTCVWRPSSCLQRTSRIWVRNRLVETKARVIVLTLMSHHVERSQDGRLSSASSGPKLPSGVQCDLLE